MAKRHHPLSKPLTTAAAVLLVLVMPQAAAAQPPDPAVPSRDATVDVPGATVDDSYVTVTFRAPPAATHAKLQPGERLNPRANEVRAHVADLRGHQREFREWLAQRHPQAEVVGEFQLVANAVTIERNDASMAQLRGGPGVADVAPAVLFRPAMNASVELVNAPAMWSLVDGDRPGAGAGVDVAVLDTGIDYSHPFFGCKDTDDVIQKLYYSGEVADHLLPPTPPDAPEDMWNAHGTHVSGTIGGCVAEVLGQTWSGIAPAATLHDYNVFPARGVGYAFQGGSAFSHDIARALEDAVADGMDVVNMSLGGGEQGPNDFLEQVTNATVDAGVTVVASAGNAGPGPETVGSPAGAENAIAVAASTNQQIFGVEVSVAGAASPFAGTVGDFGPAAETAGDLANWAEAAAGDTLACTPIAGGSFETSQVVLIERGACTFTTKIRNAETAGAGGVLMYNNVAGPPSALVHDGTDPLPQIPAVMVTADAGAAILSGLPATVTLPAAATAALITDDAFANVIAGFSSRGPTPFGARLKPEVTAPGVNILSSVFGSGLAFFSGTSMSSPHIAGAAAALLSLHPDWSPADVKSAVVNTADPTAVTDHVSGTEDPGVLARGAGLADLGAAAVTPVTLDAATIGFGAWRGNRPVGADRQVTIRNVSGSMVSCALELTGDTGIVDLSDVQVALASGAAATVTVTLSAGNHLVTPSGDYDGALTVDCGGDGAVHAPWWVRIARAD